jgi:hypothetical protein
MLGAAVTTNSQLVPLDAKNRVGGSLRVLFGMNASQLAEWMAGVGEPKWRGRQLAEAIYRQRIVEVEGITTLSRELREKLGREGWHVGRPRIVQVFTSVDGTERYLVQGQSADGLTVETVWMPEGDGGEEEAGAGAKALTQNAAFAARLKSCPDTNVASSAYSFAPRSHFSIPS